MRAPMAVGVRKSNGVLFDRAQFPGRNQRRVHRRELVRGNHHHMVQNVAIAGQVEIAMMRQIDDRVLVGSALYCRRSALSCVSV